MMWGSFWYPILPLENSCSSVRQERSLKAGYVIYLVLNLSNLSLAIPNKINWRGIWNYLRLGQILVHVYL